MPSYCSAYEKFLRATEIMATDKGTRAYRLGLVTTSYFLHLTPLDVPEEMRAELKEFMAGMTSKKDPNQGTTHAMGKIWWTRKQMPWQTAEKLSKQLFNMFMTVSEYRNKSRN